MLANKIWMQSNVNFCTGTDQWGPLVWGRRAIAGPSGEGRGTTLCPSEATAI